MRIDERSFSNLGRTETPSIAPRTVGSFESFSSTVGLLVVLCWVLGIGHVGAQPDLSKRLASAADEAHPRLFVSADEWGELSDRIGADQQLKALREEIRRQAEAMLELEPVEREKVGRRLLGVSRTALKRVSYLGFAYRSTGDERFADRAEREMLAVAGFKDWNPSHFLDVAEMTAALAIGYDWLYEVLGEEARQTIRQAIAEKGLQTSFDEAGWWVDAENNWGQVCHGGLTLGALAVAEDYPALSEKVIRRALDKIEIPMGEYGPNGSYPEGPGYWGYGTTYNVVFIDALQSVLGTDFGLSGHEPFMSSPRYYLHAHGPTGLYFNYSDSGAHASIAPAMYWFARKLDESSLLWLERQKLGDYLTENHGAQGGGHRLLPMLLLWTPESLQLSPPDKRHYQGVGANPIGIHRAEWDDQATYVGIKAGSPRENHGHMDIGSFVMDAKGVRWAVDLGSQSYHSLESKGINLWNMQQDSERWGVFRLNNRSHNTLVVNDQLQRVDGEARIEQFSRDASMPHTVIEMTEVYKGQLSQAKRGIALLGDKVLVQDEIETPANEKPVEIRWAMVTRAKVEMVKPNRAILRDEGKQLGVELLQPTGETLEIYSTKPPHSYDTTNPGTRMIGFKTRVEGGTQEQLAVLLRPGGLGDRAIQVKPLNEW